MKVRVNNLCFSFDDKTQVLRNAHFSVEDGGSLAIVGASGCGKSTILKLVAGLHPGGQTTSVEGVIEIAGVDTLLNKNKDIYLKHRSKGNLGYLSQHPTLFDHLNVEENIELPGKLLNSSNKAFLKELIELVGLTEHIHKLPSQLSGGMRTRTALARLFSTHPSLLLLDEPFSSLDIARKSRLYSEFDKLRDKYKTTTIIVTHDIFEAMVFSDTLCVMTMSGETKYYNVKNWKPNQTYEAVVKRHFSCFSEISAVIKSNA